MPRPCHRFRTIRLTVLLAIAAALASACHEAPREPAGVTIPVPPALN